MVIDPKVKFLVYKNSAAPKAVDKVVVRVNGSPIYSYDFGGEELVGEAKERYAIIAELVTRMTIAVEGRQVFETMFED